MKKQHFNRGLASDAPLSQRGSSLAWIVTAIVIIGLFGLGAVVFLKGNNSSNPTGTNTSEPNASPGSTPSCSGSDNGSNCGGNTTQATGNATNGTITALTATSITIQPSSGGADETFATTSSTLVSSPPSPGHAPTESAYRPTDFQVGDTVQIVTSSANSNQAKSILLEGSN